MRHRRLFAAEVHIDHRDFAATTACHNCDSFTVSINHTLSNTIFNHDFVEWGGTYFKTVGLDLGVQGLGAALLGNVPQGVLVIDVKQPRLLRRENLFFFQNCHL